MFLNAMTDLGHKIILQNSIFKSYDGGELIILSTLVNALIVLPFVLLFSPAGYLSDKYDKRYIIQLLSKLAIGIVALIVVSYYMGWFWIAFGLTLLLSAQSAIYSPAKYGLIKEMCGNENLALANGVVQAITIISILLGALLYSIGFEYLLSDNYNSIDDILTQIAPMGFILLISTVVEYMFASKLLAMGGFRGSIKDISFEPKRYFNLSYLRENISTIWSNQTVMISIIGLSIFWAISQVFIAIFGEYLKSVLMIDNTIIAQGLLSLSGIGIIIGALYAGRASRDFVEIGLIPIGAFGIFISILLIPSTHSLLVIGLDIFIFGLSAGIFIVPLNTLIQLETPTEYLGKVLAGNNFVQNIAMLMALVVTTIIAFLGLQSGTIFYLLGFIAFIGMGYTVLRLPQSLVRYIIKFIIGLRYRLRVVGLNNIDDSKGVLLLGNHISFLDWAILQMAYPKQIRFVIDREYYQKWYFKPFLDFFNVIPISTRGSKSALSSVSEALNRGECVALFPEGHISRNGHLSEFQRGFEIILSNVDKNRVVVTPFYLKGLWEDKFSYASNKMKAKRTKDISVHFGSSLGTDIDRVELKKAIMRLSIDSWQDYASTLPSIQSGWIDSAKRVGKRLSIADSTGVELSGYKMIASVWSISSLLKGRLKEQNIGLILPTSAGGTIANISILTLGKTIVNLNYSASIESLLYAIEVADIKEIVTSKQFITKLKAKGFDMSEILSRVDVIYFEELKDEISKPKFILSYIASMLLPARVLEFAFIKKVDTSDTASILFSSGSEGLPKAIELTHTNIMGNIKQAITLINPTDSDVMLGTLPIFHSFGLTVTTLLPLIEGVAVVAHPDPTDGFGIGKISAKYQATILFATATFYRLYIRNRKLHPLMFKDLRLVIAGAEKLPNEIREEFKKKFGKEIYEGYGATETTPVASVNIPDVLMLDTFKPHIGNRVGSVGLPLPGSCFKIVNPDTFEELRVGEDGMILIGGTQIMKGYLKNPEKSAEVIKEIDGIRWYVSGDKGHIDEDGFLFIVDRYSRFAKLGGEMVSLGLVESSISKVLNETSQIAITALKDSKKGEKIVLLLEGDMSIDELKVEIKRLNLNPLFIPAQYLKVDEIPKLGSGKSDFKAIKRLANELIG
jgi:acyl-[acyl-carrier-protein]-phospholipid O-acyltransferase/long-chain-fatty-acid--[acyl-carrier-protein] ligase